MPSVAKGQDLRHCCRTCPNRIFDHFEIKLSDGVSAQALSLCIDLSKGRARLGHAPLSRQCIRESLLRVALQQLNRLLKVLA